MLVAITAIVRLSYLYLYVYLLQAAVSIYGSCRQMQHSGIRSNPAGGKSDQMKTMAGSGRSSVRTSLFQPRACLRLLRTGDTDAVRRHPVLAARRICDAAEQAAPATRRRLPLGLFRHVLRRRAGRVRAAARKRRRRRSSDSRLSVAFVRQLLLHHDR